MSRDSIFDTIAAIATPTGAGGIGIIRISGDDAFSVADRVFRGQSGAPLGSLRGYRAALGGVYEGGTLLDEAVALVFRAPHSYTTEDTVELMCHGGETAVKSVLRAVLTAGARPADAGEFTKRAYLNGRITLTQAEAVAGLVSAVSAQGLRASAAAAGGSLHRATQEIKQQLVAAAAHISASIDFPEEDVPPADIPEISKYIDKACEGLSKLLSGYDTGSAVLRGIPTAIVGRANVGKSTLMNLLTKSDKAIVTSVAGTTRDVLEQTVNLGGAVLLLKDTAGIRETDDEVERIGVGRAVRELENAALVLAVFDTCEPLSQQDAKLIQLLHGKKVLAVVNKSDLPCHADIDTLKSEFSNIVSISANNPADLQLLEQAISRVLGTQQFDPNAPLLANERQRDAARRAFASLETARESIACGLTADALSIDITEALEALAQLDGQDVSDEVVDRIFKDFCVGK